MAYNLEQEIQDIHQRNKRVELDKAWETSWTRRSFITVVTYIIAGIWLILINDKYPWLKAFIPAGAYILSTLTLPILKNFWSNNK